MAFIVLPPKRKPFLPFHISHNMYAIVIRIKGFPRELVDESKARRKSSQGETWEAKRRAGSQFTRSWCQHSAVTSLWKNKCFIVSLSRDLQQWQREQMACVVVCMQSSVGKPRCISFHKKKETRGRIPECQMSSPQCRFGDRCRKCSQEELHEKLPSKVRVQVGDELKLGWLYRCCVF